MARKAAAGRARNPWFVVRRSAIHRRGAFAIRRIPKGTRIVEYTGKRITIEEALRLYDPDLADHDYTLLFTCGPGIMIDAGQRGGPAKYINHSCGPNCRFVHEDGRVFIVARKEIASGEELTYDYKLGRVGPMVKDWRKRYACRCGSRRCRGTMLAKPPTATALK